MKSTIYHSKNFDYEEVSILMYLNIYRIRREIRKTGEALSDEQLDLIYNELVKLTGGNLETIRFLIKHQRTEIDITLRGYVAYVMSRCKKVSDSDITDVVNEVMELFDSEDIPFIKNTIAFTFSRLGKLDISISLLESLIQDFGTESEAGKVAKRLIGIIKEKSSRHMLLDRTEHLFIKDLAYTEENRIKKLTRHYPERKTTDLINLEYLMESIPEEMKKSLVCFEDALKMIFQATGTSYLFKGNLRSAVDEIPFIKLEKFLLRNRIKSRNAWTNNKN